VARRLHSSCLLAIFSAGLALGYRTQAAPGQANSGGPAQTQEKSAGDKTAQAPPANSHDDSSTDGLQEEDESLKPKIYPFNPLEAERNIKVGNFYMRQGDARGYRAAIGRFEDATRYNPTSGEAFFRLGEAEEKLKHPGKAKAAFERVLKVSPDSKLAKDAKKKLAALE
jgi:tetratricopeptide (TPR) repeat protein